MKNKYDIIAIMGKAGSGKDTLSRALLKQPKFNNAQLIVSCTTRPIRDYEQDGLDYHFLTMEQFSSQVLSGEMLEATVFNNWCYGTSINNLSQENLNIGVFNPEGCEALRESKNINLFLIYIEANDKDRLLRQLNREDNPDCHEIVRRFSADEEDFSEDEIEYLAPDIFIINNKGANINNIAQAVVQAWEKGKNN